MAEELLDGTDVIAGEEEMRGEGVAKGVTGRGFVDLGGTDGAREGALECAGEQVVPAKGAGFGVDR